MHETDSHAHGGRAAQSVTCEPTDATEERITFVVGPLNPQTNLKACQAGERSALS